jgi:hypothetical protein
MQATTCFHDSIPNAILQEANFVFHNPVAFHPTNGVLHTDSDGRNTTIVGFLRRREFTPTRFFLGLEHCHTGQEESLKACILIETTARWQGIARQICDALIMRSAFIGGTQKANVAGLIDHEEVFERVAFLLAAVILLLILRVFWTLDWSFGPIMKKRGVGAGRSVAGGVSIVAKSSAVRAGRSSWPASA